jgi:hypothetical protein
MPFVFCGCETWPLTLREDHRLRVFENRVLKKVFGPKRYDVTGAWAKLHNVELYNLYLSPNFIRLIRSREIKERYHLEDPGVEVRIILEWIFKK